MHDQSKYAISIGMTYAYTEAACRYGSLRGILRDVLVNKATLPLPVISRHRFVFAGVGHPRRVTKMLG